MRIEKDIESLPAVARLIYSVPANQRYYLLLKLKVKECGRTVKEPLIHTAIKQNQNEVLKYMLESIGCTGDDADHIRKLKNRNMYMYTSTHWAVMKLSSQVDRMISDRIIQRLAERRDSLLSLAVKSNHENIVQSILLLLTFDEGCKALTNWKYVPLYETPIIIAAEKWNIKPLVVILEWLKSDVLKNLVMMFSQTESNYSIFSVIFLRGTPPALGLIFEYLTSYETHTLLREIYPPCAKTILDAMVKKKCWYHLDKIMRLLNHMFGEHAEAWVAQIAEDHHFLFRAVKYKNYNVVKYILVDFSSPELKTSLLSMTYKGDTLFSYALTRGSQDTINLIRNQM